MAKTLAEALKKPANIGARVPDPPQPPVPTVIPRELPGLSGASLGPAPAIWTTSYDSVKQFYKPGTSQQRFSPQPTKANPALNAQAASVATTIVNNAIAAQTKSSAPVTQILLNKQIVPIYTVQLSDLNTLISMTDNAGGVVILPRAGSGAQFIQTKSAFIGTSSATVSMTNFQGSTLLLTTFVSPNIPLDAQTVTDTNGNVWTAIETCSANTELQTLWVAYNVKGGPNVITMNQAYTAPTPPPIQYPFFSTADIDEFGGIVAGGLDQIAQGSASASISPTVTPSVAYCSIRATADSSSLTPPAGWMSLVFPHQPWNYPAYDGGGPGGVINGLDQYLSNPPVGVSLVGTATGTFISDSNVITANFKTSTTPGANFPYGWFCYVENTSTGNYYVQSLGPIDGVVQSILLSPNTGLLLVADGKGGWWSDRGVGASSAVVNSFDGLSGVITVSSSGSTIDITTSGQNINFDVAGGSGPAPQSIWTYPGNSTGDAGSMNPVSGHSMNFVANQVNFFYISIPVALEVGHFSFQVTGSDTHNYDWGMYDPAGTLIWNLGATVFGSTGLIETAFAQGTVIIEPGNYWLAFTGNGTGLIFNAVTSTIVNMPFFFANSKTGDPAWWTSVTASTGGTLTGLSPVVPSAPTTATNLTNGFTNIFGAQGVIPLIALST